MEIPKETSQKGCFSNHRHLTQQIDPAIQSLRTRITDLEIANASLGTSQETLKEQFTLSQTKVVTLEKEVELLKKENLALNDIILELRKEFEQVASLVRSQKVLSRDDSLNISRETKDTSKMVSYNSTSSPIIDQLKNNNFSFSGKDSGIPVITVQSVEEEIPIEFIEEEKPLNYLVLSQPRKVINSPANPFPGQNNLMSPNLGSARDSLVNPRKKTIVPNRNSRKKPNEKFTPEKLFENFLVIGATKESVSKQLNSDASKRTYNFTNNQTTSIEGNILFNYAENRGLPSNATPAGIDKILASWDLLLTGYDIDSKKAEDSFFKVVLKGQKRYKKRYICPFRPHTDEILLADWNDYSEMINPQNKLYALCIQKGDYVMVTDEATGKEHFVFMDTIYCLLTYYPIPQLCFNLLISVLNLIRKRRKELFWEQYHGDRSKIDFSLLDTLFLNEVSNYLNNLHQLAFPSPNRTIKYDFNDGKFDQTVSVEYTCPSESNAFAELAIWGAYNTFSSFSLKDISLILSTILLDKTVVFFSSDVTNLTATLNTFLALLFPFKYPFKIAPLMTTDMLYLFDNFQATILCVNRKEEYFWRKELADFPHLFVFLDSKTIFIHEDNTEILDAPTLNFMIKPLQDVYKELNKSSKFEVINKLSALKTKMNSTSRRLIRENSKIDIENVQPEQVRKSQNILSAFRKRIESDILTYIRPFEGHNPVEVKEVDMDKLIDSLMQDKKARKFFYELKKTCVFINYPQTVNLTYERQKSQK